MLDDLPGALRARVVLACVVAVVATVGAVVAVVISLHLSVWMQVRAETLALHQAPVAARSVGGTEGDDGGAVRLADGRKLPLWHPEFRSDEVWLSDGESTSVYVLPGGDRAVLAAEVPGADYPWYARVADWVLRLPRAVSFVAVIAALAYAAVRLALGLTPLALPSLLRRRERTDVEVRDYERTGRGEKARVTVVHAGAPLSWDALIPVDAVRLGQTVHLAGAPRVGGWVVGWTDDEARVRLRPTSPARTPAATALPRYR